MSSIRGSTSDPSSRCSTPSPMSGGSAPGAPDSSTGPAIESQATTMSRSAPRSSAGLIGAFRRVPPSKYQPRAIDGLGHLDRREQQRDRGRRADVVELDPRRHVGDGVRAVVRPPAVLVDEHDAAPGARRGGDHGQRVDRTRVDVGRELVPVDPAGEVLPQRLRVEQARQPHSRYGEQLARVAERRERPRAAGDRADHLVLREPAPELGQPGDRLERGQVLRRREPGRVQRPDARAHEYRRPLAALLEHGQQHGQRAGLVGPARPSAGEHQSRGHSQP